MRRSSTYPAGGADESFFFFFFAAAAEFRTSFQINQRRMYYVLLFLF